MAIIGVSNSSPIIVLSAAGRTDLLRDAFDSLLIPEEVAREVISLPRQLATVQPVKDRLHALSA